MKKDTQEAAFRQRVLEYQKKDHTVTEAAINQHLQEQILVYVRHQPTFADRHITMVSANCPRVNSNRPRVSSNRLKVSANRQVFLLTPADKYKNMFLRGGTAAADNYKNISL